MNINVISDEHLDFFTRKVWSILLSLLESILSFNPQRVYWFVFNMSLKPLTYSIFWKIKISCLRWIIVNEKASCLIFELHCHVAVWAERILILMESFFFLSSFPWNSTTVIEKEIRILLHFWGSSKLIALKIEILKIT